VLKARVSTVPSVSPRFRTVSIIPGMENFEPERTERRSGVAGSPNFFPDFASTAASASRICFSSPGGNRPFFA